MTDATDGEGSRALTDKQAADLARQAGKYIKPRTQSQKGITVKSGSIRIADGKLKIADDPS